MLVVVRRGRWSSERWFLHCLEDLFLVVFAVAAAVSVVRVFLFICVRFFFFG